MSEPHFIPPPPEPEGLQSPTLVAVIVATLIVFAGSTLIVVGLEHVWTEGRQDYRHAQVPAQLKQPKLNLLEQIPFADGARAKATLGPQRAQLSSYGWVDRPKGLAREPVDVAMDQLVKEAGR